MIKDGRMNKELIINSSGEGVEIALLEDKKLVELHYERGQDEFAVGDLFFTTPTLARISVHF